jgi:hypothetical protein
MNMKRIKKIMLYTAAVCSAVFPLCAEDQILLPDVTTVISGGELSAGKEAVPDFSNVVPDTSQSPVLPVLPDLSESTDSQTGVISSPADTSKTLYAEGLVGGGYPGFFTGLFSIYRSEGKEPFRISFSHNSMNGYARNSFSEGFFDNTTSVSGEKSFTINGAALKLGGVYDTTADGLQNTETDVYDVTRQSADGYAGMVWTLPHSFLLRADAAGGWYNRFAGITGTPDILPYVKSVTVFSAAPSMSFGWSGYGITTGFSTAYTAESDTGGSLSGSALHRGRFGVDFGYKNDFFHVQTDAAAVVGTKIGRNPVIVPFHIGSGIACVTLLSPRKLLLSAEGGLDSTAIAYRDLEKKYSFTGLARIPGETSDWYGKASVSVPFRDNFAFSTDAEFRTTALGNGVWEPVYDAAPQNGLYTYRQTGRSLFSSDMAVSFQHGIFSLTGSWLSQWLYVPVLETPNALSLKISLQDSNSFWGFDADYRQPLGAGYDTIPYIIFSGFYRLTPSVRLAVTADDIIKLISGNTRTYAGRYIAKSGSAGLMLKFFF